MRRKRLGQHFLMDENILRRLVNYGEVCRGDVVLEIGAGRGLLTEKIAERAGKVVAIEIDERLAAEAEERLRRYSNVVLLVGDILELKPTGFNKVVSNPPYSISTKLIRWLVESLPEKIVLTLQREFASKLLAAPSSSRYVYTSLLTRVFYESKVMEIIPRRLFNPPPRVDSAIIVMDRKREARPLTKREKEFLKFLFTRKKQKLRRVLRDYSETRGVNFREIEKVIPRKLLEKRIYTLTPNELIYCSNKFNSFESLT